MDSIFVLQLRKEAAIGADGSTAKLPDARLARTLVRDDVQD